MVTYTNFSDLASFYEKLDSELLKPPGENPCGNCIECCKYLFYLSKYEFDLMKSALEHKSSSFSIKFVTLLPWDTDPRLSQDIYICPLWVEKKGCCIYPARPLACRLMGAYLPYNSERISHCIYQNPFIYHQVEEIPLWEDFVKLLRKYPSPPGYFTRDEIS